MVTTSVRPHSSPLDPDPRAATDNLALCAYDVIIITARAIRAGTHDRPKCSRRECVRVCFYAILLLPRNPSLKLPQLTLRPINRDDLLRPIVFHARVNIHLYDDLYTRPFINIPLHAHAHANARHADEYGPDSFFVGQRSFVPPNTISTTKQYRHVVNTTTVLWFSMWKLLSFHHAVRSELILFKTNTWRFKNTYRPVYPHVKHNARFISLPIKRYEKKKHTHAHTKDVFCIINPTALRDNDSVACHVAHDVSVLFRSVDRQTTRY